MSILLATHITNLLSLTVLLKLGCEGVIDDFLCLRAFAALTKSWTLLFLYRLDLAASSFDTGLLTGLSLSHFDRSELRASS